VIQDILVALSLATFLLVEVWFELLFMPETSTYYLAAPRTAADYGAALVVVGLIAAVLVAGMRVARRQAFARWRWIAHAGILVALALPLNAMRLEVRLPLGIGRLWHIVEQHGLVLPAALLALGVLALAVRFHRWFGRAVYVLLLVSSPFAVVTLVRAATRVVTGYHDRFETLHVAKGSVRGTIGERQVVWLLFDELDEGVLAGARPKGLALPALDRLRSESLAATRALPPSDSTLVSMPALWTGKTVTGATPRGASALGLTLADGSQEELWTDSSNVFCSAHAEGYRTAMVGWYHPYCRQFGDCFDSCAATPVFLSTVGRDAERSFAGRVFDQVRTVLPTNRRRIALESFEAILAGSRALLDDSRPGLMFVHFPIPHVPAIYDQRAKRLSGTRFSNLEGYLDNVALVDRTVEDLRRRLEEQGRWEGVTLLVTADHGWRERAAYDGVRHREVPFLLKLAHQRSGVVYEKPFRTVVTGELLAAILRGSISQPEEVVASLDRVAER